MNRDGQHEKGTGERSSFGALLRRFRLDAGLSQEALAELAMISKEGVGALERGTNRSPQRETLALLVGALKLNVEQQRAIEAAAERPSRPRASRETSRKKHNLPRVPSRTFGREKEIGELTKLIANSSLVTLTGAGGVGKTRLAIEIGHKFAGKSEDEVKFVDLASVRNPSLVVTAIGAQLGIIESSREPLIETLTSALCRKDTLLILDNCEHLAKEIAAVAESIVSGCSRTRILATSRQSLHVAGEQTYRVASLAFPESANDLCATEVLRYPSAALFADSARKVSESFQVTDENAGSVARICKSLDGIALAIELAAKRVRLLSPRQIEERLTERFQILTGGSHLALPRHQTMRATIDWSYDLLETNEKLLFSRLSIFASSFSLEAAGEVCADEAIEKAAMLDLLGLLADKSLVSSESHAAVHRFRLLESLRAYASEKLQNDAQRMRRRHAEYYTGFAENAAVWASAGPSAVEPDLGNFRAALEWTLDEGKDVVLGVRLLSALREFWLWKGLAAQTARRAEQVLSGTHELSPQSRADVLSTLASMRGDQILAAPAFDAATQAVELYGELGDLRGLSRALRDRGIARTRLGEHVEAEKDLLRSFELSRDLGENREMLRALGAYALALKASRRLAEARVQLMHLLETARELGDDRSVGTTLVNIAEVDFASGDFQSAVSYARESLQSDLSRTNLRSRANQRANLAVYELAMGSADDARKTAGAAIREAIEAGDHIIVANALQTFAAIRAHDDAPRAAQLLGYVESVYESARYVRETTERFAYDAATTHLNNVLSENEIESFKTLGAKLNETQAQKMAHGRAGPPRTVVAGSG